MTTTTTTTKTLTPTMNIEDWVNYHRIPHILIDIRYKEVNGKLEKDKEGLKTPSGWQEWDYEKCMEFNKTKYSRNGMNINVGAVGMAVIDTDSEEQEKEIQELNLKLPITRTKKGCHRYFQIDQKYKAYRGNKIDLITINIFEKRNRTVKYADNIRALTPEYIENLYHIKLQPYGTQKKVEIKRTGEKELNAKEQDRMDFSDYDTILEESKLRRLVDALNPNEFTTYSMWWAFICGIYNQVPCADKNREYFAIATDFLKQLPDYNDTYHNENTNVWFLSLPTSKLPDDEKIHSGTLLKWLREQNPEVYKDFRVRNAIDPPKFNALGDYKKQKREFEKYCFKVNSVPAFVVVDKETGKENLYKKGDFMFRWERLYTIDPKDEEGKKTEFTKVWMKDQYGLEYDNMDFIPPYLDGKKTQCPDYTYNMFKGLQAEKLSGKIVDLSVVKQHLMNLCEEREDVYNYVMKWMANMVRYTGRKPNVCLVFVSEEGVGKNMFWEWFGKEILGEQYFCVSANADDFIGKFSTLDSGKLLSILNEAMGKDTFKGDHRLKEKITDNKTGLEKKGIDRVQINNCNSWIMFSNQFNCAKVDWGNRRHMVINCSAKPLGIPNYFVDLKKHLDDPNVIYSFYQELKHSDEWDCIDYDFKRERVFTKAYYEMRANNIPHLVRFLKFHFERFDYKPIKSYDFYNRYKGWAEEMNETQTTSIYSETKFMIMLGQCEGVFVRKEGRLNMVRFDETDLFNYTHKYYKDLDAF